MEPSGGRLSVASLVLEYLKQEGVDAVFGIPGGPATPLFDALGQDEAIRLISCRHESGAGFMACGYARMSGRPGVCFLTTGPGATNALTAVCAARADGLPVLAVTAQSSTADFGKGPLQDSSYDGIDTVSLFRPAVKLSMMVANPGQAAAAIRQCLRVAMSGRRGPVHLSLPGDVMRAAVAADVQSPAHYRVASAPFDRQALLQACSRLLAARRPAILAGHGVALAQAQPELLELCELLKAPVATTPKAKGCFDESHSLSLGVFGLASAARARKYLLEGRADLLLVLGSSLHEMSTQGWDPRLRPEGGLVQVDLDAGALGRNYPVDVGVVGDVKATLREMTFALRRMLAHGEHGRIPEGDRGFSSWARGVDEEDAAAFSDEEPIKPQRLLAALERVLPRDAVVCLDVGGHTLWALSRLRADGRKVFLNNWGSFAAMGYGVAGAVGAKLAVPGRPVVAIVGDGGFGMSGMEVSTAVTYGVPVVWVVFNDARYNAVYHGQRLQYGGRTAGAQFCRMDLAAVARGLGAVGLSVRRPGNLEEAFRRALTCGRPAVVDVRVDADEVPPILSRVRSLEASFAGVAA